ncbi:MAG: hypothetical protein RIT45_998 [Pseudomonadota bacterium]|jgi:16S rRNA G1207 methylase RsmC
MAEADRIEVAGRTLQLRRYPERGESSLHAVDHGERALLAALPPGDGPLLLVGEGHGALGLGTLGRERIWVADLARTRAAYRHNAAANDLPDDVPFCTPLAIPSAAPSGRPFAAALLAWPRAIEDGVALLERLAAAVPAGTPVVIGVRSDALSKRGFEAITVRLDDAETPRAEGRRRRIVGRLRGGAGLQARRFSGPDGLRLVSHAGLFTHGRVDQGSARLLAALGPTPAESAGVMGSVDRVLDLGCGDGVLAVTAAARMPLAEVVLVDDSALAVDAACATFAANADRVGPVRVRGLHANRCDAVETGTIDLVLCNPPFHDGAALSRSTAARMFEDAARVLRPGGALVVVANRHLHYDDRLRRHFAHVAVAQVDPRFVVLRARR